MRLKMSSYKVAAIILHPSSTLKKIAQNKKEIIKYKYSPGLGSYRDELEKENKILQYVLDLDKHNNNQEQKIALIIDAFLKEPYLLSVENIINANVDINLNKNELKQAIQDYYGVVS